MSIISLTSLAFAMLIFAASPGPGVFTTVAKSIASGFIPSLKVIAGIVIGDLVYLMFAIFGLQAIASLFGKIFIIIKICGGAYLIWLGLKLIFSKVPSDETAMQLKRGDSNSGDFLSGLLITLSNPKAILFYCGFLPTFVDLKSLSYADILIIACVVSIVLSFVLTTYAYIASRTRLIFSGSRSIKILNKIAGSFMMTTGIIIATDL